MELSEIDKISFEIEKEINACQTHISKIHLLLIKLRDCDNKAIKKKFEDLPEQWEWLNEE